MSCLFQNTNYLPFCDKLIFFSFPTNYFTVSTSDAKAIGKYKLNPFFFIIPMLNQFYSLISKQKKNKNPKRKKKIVNKIFSGVSIQCIGFPRPLVYTSSNSSRQKKKEVNTCSLVLPLFLVSCDDFSCVASMMVSLSQ